MIVDEEKFDSESASIMNIIITLMTPSANSQQSVHRTKSIHVFTSDALYSCSPELQVVVEGNLESKLEQHGNKR